MILKPTSVALDKLQKKSELLSAAAVEIWKELTLGFEEFFINDFIAITYKTGSTVRDTWKGGAYVSTSFINKCYTQFSGVECRWCKNVKQSDNNKTV